MFTHVFLNADDARETDFVVFVSFRRRLKKLLRLQYEDVFRESPGKVTAKGQIGRAHV